eukprot:TRINITY_DN46109_c0_g1_i1.p1 TRINITY_DN46109_c0_g1~~TRINITY_DN46109_c0_g1_i1.p1  ORF type:complete len:365 (+),score=70.73 TRINITY_DN46109_c0_g1_i1:66-1160(+)
MATVAPLPNPDSVATVVLGSGDEDPAKLLSSGRHSMQWGGRTVSKFRQVEVPQLRSSDLALPTLYLHFLAPEFRMADDDEKVDNSLRSGNDMSEVMMRLPGKFLQHSFVEQCGPYGDAVKIVIEALRDHGETLVNSSKKVTAGELFFSLRTARPKSGISLNKAQFGIPTEAEQYLFVNNHSSVIYFSDRVKEAFNECIAELPSLGPRDISSFATFLKVFYEGGFGYNKKIPMGRGYLPVNVGIAAMSVVPSFDGQVGIGTGYPYQLPSRFLPFVETVPISIDAIRAMSERHGRYGLAFTRCVFVWEGDQWQQNGTLDFCSILPHGGFYYVPDTPERHREVGGLVYAFGESRDDNIAATVEGHSS